MVFISSTVYQNAGDGVGETPGILLSLLTVYTLT